MKEELYKDNLFKISSDQYPDCHHLWIKDHYFYLDRGILNDLSRRDTESLRSGLGAMSAGVVDYVMRQNNLSYDALGWAMARAKMAEMEDEISYHISENQKIN